MLVAATCKIKYVSPGDSCSFVRSTLLTLWIEETVCESHVCRYGANVTAFGLPNQVYRFIGGRLAGHYEMNDTIMKALQASVVLCL